MNTQGDSSENPTPSREPASDPVLESEPTVPPSNVAPQPHSPLENASHSATPVLAVLILLTIALNLVNWATGDRGRQLAIAVERGSARVEQQLRGEVTNDEALQTIRLQSDSLGFWMAIAAIRDFVIEPVGLIVRTLLLTLVGAAAITLSRREFRWHTLMFRVAQWQSLWTGGLLLQIMLNLLMNQPADTSMRLLLPGGDYLAIVWVALGQLSLLACVGWIATFMMFSFRFGASMLITLPLLGMLMMSEWLGMTVYDLILEAGMRTTLVP